MLLGETARQLQEAAASRSDTTAKLRGAAFLTKLRAQAIAAKRFAIRHEQQESNALITALRPASQQAHVEHSNLLLTVWNGQDVSHAGAAVSVHPKEGSNFVCLVAKCFRACGAGASSGALFTPAGARLDTFKSLLEYVSASHAGKTADFSRLRSADAALLQRYAGTFDVLCLEKGQPFTTQRTIPSTLARKVRLESELAQLLRSGELGKRNTREHVQHFPHGSRYCGSILKDPAGGEKRSAFSRRLSEDELPREDTAVSLLRPGVQPRAHSLMANLGSGTATVGSNRATDAPSSILLPPASVSLAWHNATRVFSPKQKPSLMEALAAARHAKTSPARGEPDDNSDNDTHRSSTPPRAVTKQLKAVVLGAHSLSVSATPSTRPLAGERPESPRNPFAGEASVAPHILGALVLEDGVSDKSRLQSIVDRQLRSTALSVLNPKDNSEIVSAARRRINNAGERNDQPSTAVSAPILPLHAQFGATDISRAISVQSIRRHVRPINAHVPPPPTSSIKSGEPDDAIGDHAQGSNGGGGRGMVPFSTRPAAALESTFAAPQSTFVGAVGRLAERRRGLLKQAAPGSDASVADDKSDATSTVSTAQDRWSGGGLVSPVGHSSSATSRSKQRRSFAAHSFAAVAPPNLARPISGGSQPDGEGGYHAGASSVDPAELSSVLDAESPMRLPHHYHHQDTGATAERGSRIGSAKVGLNASTVSDTPLSQSLAASESAISAVTSASGRGSRHGFAPHAKLDISFPLGIVHNRLGEPVRTDGGLLARGGMALNVFTGDLFKVEWVNSRLGVAHCRQVLRASDPALRHFVRVSDDVARQGLYNVDVGKERFLIAGQLSAALVSSSAQGLFGDGGVTKGDISAAQTAGDAYSAVRFASDSETPFVVVPPQLSFLTDNCTDLPLGALRATTTFSWLLWINLREVLKLVEGITEESDASDEDEDEDNDAFDPIGPGRQLQSAAAAAASAAAGTKSSRRTKVVVSAETKRRVEVLMRRNSSLHKIGRMRAGSVAGKILGGGSFRRRGSGGGGRDGESSLSFRRGSSTSSSPFAGRVRPGGAAGATAKRALVEPCYAHEHSMAEHLTSHIPRKQRRGSGRTPAAVAQFVDGVVSGGADDDLDLSSSDDHGHADDPRQLVPYELLPCFCCNKAPSRARALSMKRFSDAAARAKDRDEFDELTLISDEDDGEHDASGNSQEVDMSSSSAAMSVAVESDVIFSSDPANLHRDGGIIQNAGSPLVPFTVQALVDDTADDPVIIVM